jgi:hypothetical protein
VETAGGHEAFDDAVANMLDDTCGWRLASESVTDQLADRSTSER